MTTGLQTKINPLTSVRFLAAAAVVVSHARPHFACLDNVPDRLVFGQCVSFFFVLAGFILALVYPAFASGKEISAFLVKRVARLWPLHISVTLLRCLILRKELWTYPGPAPEALVLLTNIFMLSGWIPLHQFFHSYNPASWSISTEFFFYLCLPVLLVLAQFRWLPLAITFGITLASIVLCNYLGLATSNDQGLDIRGILYINPLPRLFEFVVGITAALLFRDHVSKWNISRPLMTLGEVLVMAVTALLIWYTKPIAALIGSLPMLGKAGTFWLECPGVTLLAFALLLVILSRNGGLISAILSLPLVVLLGDISYAVYLCHVPLLSYYSMYLSQFRSLSAFAVFIAVLLLVSHLLYTLIEQPTRALAATAINKALSLHKSAGLSLQTLAELVQITAKRISELPGFAFSQLKSRTALITASECLLLVCLLILSHPVPKRLSIAAVNELLTHGNKLNEIVSVGDSLSCMGVVAEPHSDSSSVDIVWRANKHEQLRNFVSLQLLAEDGTQLYQRMAIMASRPASMKPGDLFKQGFDLPLKDFQRSKKLAMTVVREYQESVLLPIWGGTTDMGGKRLLIDLHPQVSRKDERAVSL